MAGNFKYTRRADDSGWLGVLLSDTGKLGFLCEYTRVAIVRKGTMGKEKDRLFFKISDGNSDFVGQEASLKQQNADKFLSDDGPGGPAVVRVKYVGSPTPEVSQFKGPLTQQWAKATFNGEHATVTLNSVWDQSFTPIPAGTHMIMAPDESHGNISTAGYRGATPGLRCTDVWFPIQLSGTSGNSGRYVHVGHLSEGCVTFHELIKWNAVYDYLISSRVPGVDGKFVGNLIVEK